MREIKFRAWDKERNCMRECVTIGCTNSDWPTLAREPWNQNFINSVEGEYELMQYTGLKDKDGKEIYESDIVLFRNKTWLVEFIEGAFLLKNVFSKCEEYQKHEYIFWSKVEVIGNIYKNPELLEVKS